MYLYSEDGGELINMDSVTFMYAGASGECVRIVTNNGTALKVGRYDDMEQCEAAIKLIAKTMRSSAGMLQVIDMPTKEQAQKAAVKPEYHHHAGNGKKPVRRGGS